MNNGSIHARKPLPPIAAQLFLVFFLASSLWSSAGAQDAEELAKQQMEAMKQVMEAQGMSAEELFDRYCMFGDDPFVQGHDFSAWDYARDQARRLSA